MEKTHTRKSCTIVNSGNLYQILNAVQKSFYIFMVGSLSPTLHSAYFKPSPFFTLNISPTTWFCADSLISNFTGKIEDSRRKHQPPALKTGLSFPPITKADSGSYCLLPSLDTAVLIIPLIFLISPISFEMELLLTIPTDCLPFTKFFNTFCLHLLSPLYFPITPQFTSIWPLPASPYWNDLPITTFEGHFQS